jgi:hypothetical protein
MQVNRRGCLLCPPGLGGTQDEVVHIHLQLPPQIATAGHRPHTHPRKPGKPRKAEKYRGVSAAQKTVAVSGELTT